MQIIKIGAFFVFCYMLVSCTDRIAKTLKLRDDNVIEELVEGIIEENTGVSIDLTPDSPES